MKNIRRREIKAAMTNNKQITASFRVTLADWLQDVDEVLTTAVRSALSYEDAMLNLQRLNLDTLGVLTLVVTVDEYNRIWDWFYARMEADTAHTQALTDDALVDFIAITNAPLAGE